MYANGDRSTIQFGILSGFQFRAAANCCARKSTRYRKIYYRIVEMSRVILKGDNFAARAPKFPRYGGDSRRVSTNNERSRGLGGETEILLCCRWDDINN